MKRSPHRLIPSMEGLAIFEAAARHLNFTRTGAELGLTQGAISRQILDLESLLGAALFDRSRRRLALTELGQEYANTVRPLLDALEEATVAAQMQRNLHRPIRLSVAASFCNRWLIPQLPAFLAKQPGTLINIASRVGRIDLHTGGFDAAVINAVEPPPDVCAIRLFTLKLAPYAAPSLLLRRPPLTAKQIAALPLLHQHEVPSAWEIYFERLGVRGLRVPGVASNTLLLVNCEAAVAGLGAALLPPQFVRPEEADGRLLRLAEPLLSGDRAYFLIWRAASEQKIASLRDWMIQTLQS